MNRKCVDLELQHREDGGIRIFSKSLVGLYVSGIDKELIFQELPDIIRTLLYRNEHKVTVLAYPLNEAELLSFGSAQLVFTEVCCAEKAHVSWGEFWKNPYGISFFVPIEKDNFLDSYVFSIIDQEMIPETSRCRPTSSS